MASLGGREEILGVFRRYDAAGTGRMRTDELEAVLKLVGSTKEEIRGCLCGANVDDGCSSYEKVVDWAFNDGGFANPGEHATVPAARGRVIVTGATGLLGRQVVRAFTERGWTVRGLGWSRAGDAIVKCDLFSRSRVEEQFTDFRPDVVIHCAGERKPAALQSNREYAFRINSEAPRNVASVCREHGAWFVYISTNYVFDGRTPPYAEGAAPCPLSVYGESKLAGENHVLSAHAGAAIVRVPLLYGPVNHLDENSISELLLQIKREAPRLDNWQQRFPTNAEDLAAVLEAMAGAYIDRGAREDPALFAGTFHWQANDAHTKYTMAKLVADVANLSSEHIIPVDGPPPYPTLQFEEMSCARLERLLGIEGCPSAFRSDMRESLRRQLADFI